MIQNEKNISNEKNVNNGWKKSPGNSAKHFALSLNKAAMKLILFLTQQTKNVKNTYKFLISYNIIVYNKMKIFYELIENLQ